MTNLNRPIHNPKDELDRLHGLTEQGYGSFLDAAGTWALRGVAVTPDGTAIHCSHRHATSAAAANCGRRLGKHQP